MLLSNAYSWWACSQTSGAWCLLSVAGRTRRTASSSHSRRSFPPHRPVARTPQAPLPTSLHRAQSMWFRSRLVCVSGTSGKRVYCTPHPPSHTSLIVPQSLSDSTARSADKAPCWQCLTRLWLAFESWCRSNCRYGGSMSAGRRERKWDPGRRR